MSVYFTYFPKITYMKQEVRDIVKRTNFVEENLSDPLLFLPYTLEDGDRPEDISYYYYGSVDYTWLVLLANKMYDPYYDWLMNDSIFEIFMISKYKKQSKRNAFEVIRWTQNMRILDNVAYFEKDDVLYSKDTVIYNTVPDEELYRLKTESGQTFLIDNFIDNSYKPLRFYEIEQILNENKRIISLVDKRYVDKIQEEFYKLMKK